MAPGQAAEASGTEAIVLEERGQHVRNCHFSQRDPCPVEPSEEVTAAAPVALERCSRVAFRRAPLHEVLVQAEAFLEFSRMRCAACLFKKPQQCDDP